MKKIFTLLFVALTGIQFTQAQSFVVYKNGQAVATYEASEVDSIVFTPAETPAENYAEAIAGDYHALMSTGVQGMPGFEPIKTEVNVKVTAEEGNKVSVVLPTASFNGMVLPSITLKGVEVALQDGVYTFSQNTSGTIEVEGEQKAYDVKFTGKVNADGTFTFTEVMKYGSMPFPITMECTKFTASGVVAGKYEAQMQATLKEMPDMGVLVDTVATITFAVQDDEHVAITLPSCNYQGMILPSVELKDVKVGVSSCCYTFNKSFKGVEEGTGKEYTVNFEGSINHDGHFNFTEEMQYGIMPFTLQMVFAPKK